MQPNRESASHQFAVDTLFPNNTSHLISNAQSRQDLVLLAARLGIAVTVVASCYARLTNNWKVASPLRGKISDSDITKLERLVADGDP